MTLGGRGAGAAEDVEVDLWLAPLEQHLRADQAALCRSILSLEERRAADRFRHMTRREQALVGRALLRRALTFRLGLAPERWIFETQSHGRPCLARGQNSRHVDFNLAHADGCVLCAVAEGADVGVDVEPLSRAGELREVASRFLAEPEVIDLATLAPDAQDERLVRLWTLKEAYSKARGSGLTMPYEEVVFRVSGEMEAAQIVCESVSGWQFHAFTSPLGHALAIAVRAPKGVARLTRRDGLDLLFGALAK